MLILVCLIGAVEADVIGHTNDFRQGLAYLPTSPPSLTPPLIFAFSLSFSPSHDLPRAHCLSLSRTVLSRSRYQFSSTTTDVPFEWYIFGGFRQFQGLSQDNSQANRWNNTDVYPYGGYFDDLWRYDYGTQW